jgi:DNA-directed RNA polymerase specialized sigma24 family protein/mRNA-degrading endonuclease RelE of RelBE toxin-antitoxin system
MKVLASPDLPAKIEALRADEQTTQNIRLALTRLSSMSTRDLKTSEQVLASEHGVYAMRQGSIRLFYAVNEVEDYVILLDVAPAGIERPSFEMVDRWETVDWEDLTKRLLLYASRQLPRRARFRSRAALDAGDYVLSAIEALLSGKSRFDGGKTTLFTFLCGVIASLIAHDIEVSQAIREAHADLNPENVLAPDDVEADYALREFAQKFIESIKEPKLREYARLRVHERYQTPSEYAKALGVSEKSVYSMNKRLRRMRHLWAVETPTITQAPRRLGTDDEVASDIAPLEGLQAVRDLPLQKIDSELAKLGVDPQVTLAGVANELASRG